MARKWSVLVRDAEALETLQKVDTLALDKTGTLTEGRPVLTQVAVSPGVREKGTCCATRLPWKH